jgi:hypothetical protein
VRKQAIKFGAVQGEVRASSSFGFVFFWFLLFFFRLFLAENGRRAQPVRLRLRLRLRLPLLPFAWVGDAGAVRGDERAAAKYLC